jgi:hypothetical protein
VASSRVIVSTATFRVCVTRDAGKAARAVERVRPRAMLMLVVVVVVVVLVLVLLLL